MELYISVSSLYNFRLREKWSFKRLQNVNLSVCVSTCVHAHLPVQCHFKLVVVVVIQSCPTLWDPMTVAHQAPLSMGFSRQEYWSGLPCPPPGDHPKRRILPCLWHRLHWQASSSSLVLPGEPSMSHKCLFTRSLFESRSQWGLQMDTLFLKGINRYF